MKCWCFPIKKEVSLSICPAHDTSFEIRNMRIEIRDLISVMIRAIFTNHKKIINQISYLLNRISDLQSAFNKPSKIPCLVIVGNQNLI